LPLFAGAGFRSFYILFAPPPICADFGKKRISKNFFLHPLPGQIAAALFYGVAFVGVSLWGDIIRQRACLCPIKEKPSPLRTISLLILRFCAWHSPPFYG